MQEYFFGVKAKIKQNKMRVSSKASEIRSKYQVFFFFAKDNIYIDWHKVTGTLEERVAQNQPHLHIIVSSCLQYQINSPSMKEKIIALT